MSGSVSSYVCATKTSVVSGCSITGATSTTSILETATAIPACKAAICGADCDNVERTAVAVNESGLEKRVFDTEAQMDNVDGYELWINDRIAALGKGRRIPLDMRNGLKADGSEDTDRDDGGRTSWRTVRFRDRPDGLLSLA